MPRAGRHRNPRPLHPAKRHPAERGSRQRLGRYLADRLLQRRGAASGRVCPAGHRAAAERKPDHREYRGPQRLESEPRRYHRPGRDRAAVLPLRRVRSPARPRRRRPAAPVAIRRPPRRRWPPVAGPWPSEASCAAQPPGPASARPAQPPAKARWPSPPPPRSPPPRRSRPTSPFPSASCVFLRVGSRTPPHSRGVPDGSRSGRGPSPAAIRRPGKLQSTDRRVPLTARPRRGFGKAIRGRTPMAKKKTAKKTARRKAPARKPAGRRNGTRRAAGRSSRSAPRASAARGAPAGMHTVTPQLTLREAARAIDFYKQAFGAQELMRMPAPDGKSIWHAEIRIGDSVVYVGDEMPQSPTAAPSPTHKPTCIVQLYVPDCDAVFQAAVQAGARVAMPLADMFWGDRYGVVTDPFGQVWGIATRVKDLSPEEMAKGAQEWIAKNAPPGGQRPPQPQMS